MRAATPIIKKSIVEDLTETDLPEGILEPRDSEKSPAPGKGQIRVENLEKTYVTRKRHGLFGSKRLEVTALRGVSLEINPGEVFGLVGPNGAGKTTLIKCLTTLLLPSKGRAWVNSYEIGKQDNEIRSSIGCMLMGDRGLYWKLTGRENLHFFGALYNFDSAKRRLRAGELIEEFRLGEVADRPVETYSSGQRMKLAFAKTLLNDAPILIFDEPTNTLDVPSARELREKIRSFSNEGRTIIYATHIMPEAESLCHRVAIIDYGSIVTSGTLAALKASLRDEEVIHLEGVIPEEARSAARLLHGVRQTASDLVNGNTRLTVVAQRSSTPLLPRVIETLTANGAILYEIRREEVTLEDVFLAYAGRGVSESKENDA